MSFLPKKIVVIAEIGSNHDGDLDKAYRLIDAAAGAGADVAKFQSFLADEMYTPEDPNYDLLKKLEMPREWYPRLMERCSEKRIKFLSTATNHTTIDWMEELGVDWYKVASGNISHTPIIDRLVDIGKPVIFSTGVSRLDEVIDLAASMRERDFQDFAFLHCVSEYPASANHIRLRNIEMLEKLVGCPVGFSDHSLTPYLAIAAVPLGARIIEKHITLDGTGLSPDHSFSLTPEQFRIMTDGIREVELGLFMDFLPNTEEMYKLRRSLHFSKELHAGHRMTEEDIVIIRPEDGLPPAMLNSVVGKILEQDVERHQPLTHALVF